MCIGIGMGGTVIWENPHWTGATATPDSNGESK
jgi:acetyl-CoA acyltransferase